MKFLGGYWPAYLFVMSLGLLLVPFESYSYVAGFLIGFAPTLGRLVEKKNTPHQ